MTGTYELQLISRYFGGPSGRWARALVLEGTKVKAADEAGSHHIHTHLAKVPRPAEKSSADEEMMQVLFTKLKSSKFHPAHQEETTGQPGH